jgi:hypothetical protein
MADVPLALMPWMADEVAACEVDVEFDLPSIEFNNACVAAFVASFDIAAAVADVTAFDGTVTL